MLLTGYDVPCLTTMYFDKPMKNHSLFQAISRVNRVYKDKPGGLIVDYIGIADDISKSLHAYSGTDIKGALIDIKLAIQFMNNKYKEIINSLTTLNLKEWKTKDDLELTRIRQKVLNEILKNELFKKQFLTRALELKKSFSLVSPRKEALNIEFGVEIIESLRKAILKSQVISFGEVEMDESIVESLITKHLDVENVQDIVKLKPRKEVAILSKDFLEEIKKVEGKNLQIELLKKLLNGEIEFKLKKNIVQSKSFRERIEKTLSDYKSRFINAAEVVKKLIEIGEELNTITSRAEKLDLNEEELAFYDMFASQKELVLNDTAIKKIVKDLTHYLKKSTTIDWSSTESIRKKIKIGVKDLLRKYGLKFKQIDTMMPLIMKQTESIYSNEVVASI
ncbi:DUF3387 domain-containing protein [Candidatus Woesearchaeota archaeon]|nr:DUF3387 domain-containing protein [Candidatus Woesearchaeota archaeon]